MNRNVTPESWSARIRVNSRSISRLSSCAVGSSRMMKRAPKLNARAISTICRSSTLRSAVRASGSTCTSQVARSSAASERSFRQLMKPRLSGCRLMYRFSATVSSGTTVGFW